MKKINLAILSLFLVFVAYSQTVIVNPKYGFTTASTIKPNKIELTDTTTNLYFKTYCAPNFWIRIPDKTYIQQDGTGDKLFIKRTEGIPFNREYYAPKAGEISYTLVFPPISSTTKFIDYGEANDGGSWFIYDIQIKPLPNVTNLPQELSGNWFNKATGNWEISFFDTLVVYKKQLWSYDGVRIEKGQIGVKLKNAARSVELTIKSLKAGKCMIGESTKELKEYRNNPEELGKRKPNGDKPYELPIFKIDSATYSGYFKGYSSRIGAKTFSILIDDIITGKQNTFIGQINSNGCFSVKLPVYYPHYVWVRSTSYNGSVYLEPGKTLFQLINPGNKYNTPLFMGESANINSDLQKLESINSFNYYDMRSKILDMKPNDYKMYFQKIHTADITALDSVNKLNNIGAKAYQVKRLDIDYNYFQNLMSYNMNFESAYREKNKISWEQRTLPVKIDTLTAEYFSFISSENANNPLAVLSSGYNSFINRLKYLDILRSSNFSINTKDIIDEVQKSGYVFTVSEKKLVEKLKEQEQINNNPELKAFQEKYGKQSHEFYTKYKDTLQNFYKKFKPPFGMDSIEIYLLGKGIKLTDNEKQLLKAQFEFQNKITKLLPDKSFSDSLNAFHRKHAPFVDGYFAKLRKNARYEKLDKVLGVKKGFASDIMDAQDACRKIVEEVTPVTESVLNEIQLQITTPFISDYIALCNQQSRLKIEANKHKIGYVINEVPKTEANLLFDSIMKKYKGKVVYVDFWATWCGPCRSGIEQIKPLKDEMGGENVVFVYITNTTSPQDTWSNMIPDIKGEHYRVSNDEWNYLSGKFNISGIPHYVLVGKNGEIINPKLGHLDNQTLKMELEKCINK